MIKNILILTTETVHHAFFVKKLSEKFKNISVICEKVSQIAFPFETHHPFETKRDEFELRKWFNGNKTLISNFAETKSFESLNGNSAFDFLAKERPDIVIVFGTGRLKKHILDLFPGKIFNLHGGDPERYRGLDSHLWAIYHQDFSALVTSLHCVSEGLDEGDIVNQQKIEITRNMPIECLRAANTEACITITTSLIENISSGCKVGIRKQIQDGRYYSAMPSPLKEICLEKFSRFTKQIK